MKPSSITTTTRAERAWEDVAIVTYKKAVYRPREIFEHALAGRTKGETAAALDIPWQTFVAALRHNPPLAAAYQAGWDEWEAESNQRAEIALARTAEGYTVEVEEVVVHKGQKTRYKVKKYFPPSPVSLTFKLERRDKERFGKDTVAPPPSVGQQALERVSLYLVEKGLGALAGVEPPRAAVDAPADEADEP